MHSLRRIHQSAYAKSQTGSVRRHDARLSLSGDRVWMSVGALTGLVDVAQQLSDFDEASHRALRLLLQPLVVLAEALHLGLQHRFVLFLLEDDTHAHAHTHTHTKTTTTKKKGPSLRWL